MAYELSSSVANGNVSAEFVAARASTLTRGGAISPDGTTIAVTSYRHGGATTTDYGIDIWKSGSSGWSEVDSIDTLSRIHHQIMWLNNDEFVSLSSNAFYSFKSGSSGWAEDYNVTVGGHSYVAMWPSADKSKIAISQTPKDPMADSTHANNSLGSKIQFLISGSGGYAVEQANAVTPGYAISDSYGPLQALTWVDNDNIVVGYSGYQSGNGLIRHYRSDGDTTWSSVSYLIGSNTQGRRNLGNFLYYHTGSDTLMVGAAGSTSESYNAYRGYINLFPSSSSGLFPSNWTSINSWAGWEKLDLDSYGLYTDQSNTSNNPYWLDGITLNVDANNGDRFVVGSGIFNATYQYNRAFITAESGSSGWLFNQLNPEGNGRGKAWATEYGWGPSQLSDDATRYVTWLTGTSATSTYGFTVYDTGLSSGGAAADVTAPTISSVELSSDNSTATVTFSEDVYPNSGGSGDLDRYDFSVSLSGGNSSVMTLNSTPSAISKTSQSVWVLTLDGTDLDFAADGTETLVVDAVDDTSIYDGSGNALTEAHSGSNLTDQNPEDYIKIRILNQEDHTLYFYTDVGYYASTLGTNGSKFRLLGSASSGEWMTSSAFPIDKWDVQAFTAGGQILSSRTELSLDQYDTDYIHINSQAETWADSSFLLTSADIKRADSSEDIRIVSASDGSRIASYLNITRPSGSALREYGDDWGEWTQYDISNTLLDTSKPSVVSSTFNSTNNELSIQFDEKIFDSNGDAYTTSSFSYGSSNQFYFSSLTSASAKNFSIEDLSYSTTTVTDDTLTITISYDGEIVDGEEANWSFRYNTLYDQYGNKNTNSVTGSTLFGATGSTRSTHNKTINIINTSDNTGYFYMKVDGNEGDWVGSSGSPPNDWIYLGTASSGETGSFTISNWAVNDRAYASSGVLTSYPVYGYTSQQLTSSFTSTAPNASSTPNFTIYNVSSSTEPYFADNRRRYDVTYRGSSFGTVIPYSGSTALDIGLNAAIITSSNSSNTLYITVDFGERVRFPGWEATEYGINFTSSYDVSSTSDLSNELTGSFFTISRDYYYTGSIGSTLTITDVNFITSPTTSVVSGAWAITASYTGLADGTERIALGRSYDVYASIFDDSLNSVSFESALASSTYSAIATWPTTDQYGNSYRVGPMTQDSLATEVSEAITAADGGSINAGGTNDAPAATISIPANALASDTTIGVDVSETPDPSGVGLGFGAQDSVSPLISLTPHGTTFSSPVTVTFKLTGIGDGACPANLQIWKRDTPTSSWILQDADNWTCTDGEISLTINSFSQILAKGGSLMARTKLNNVQLARIEAQDKVLPEAINLTGSSLAKLSSIADGDLFVVSDASDSGATRIVSASAMTSYFASNVVPTNVPITEQSNSTSYNLLFASGSDSGATLSRDADGEFAYNPSTNTLILSTGSFASASFSAGLFAAAAQITSVDINGGTIDGVTIAGSDIDMSSQALTLDDDAISGDKVEGGTIDAITITALTASSADIDGGTIDGAVIGGTSQAAGSFTAISGSTTLQVGGEATLASAIVSDLTNNRVVIAGSGGALEDDASFTFDGATLVVSASSGVAVQDGDLNVSAGAISGSGNLQAGGSATVGTGLTVTTGGLTVSAGDSTVQKLTVAGDLVVQGNTTTVDTLNLQVEDAVILLGSGSTGEGTASDRGLLMAMASEENLAMFWDEDADHFAFVRTTASATDNAITPSSYSDLKIKNLTGSAATFTGTVTANAFSGDGSGLSGVGASIDASSNADLDLQLIFTSGTTGVGEVAGLFIDSSSLQYNPFSNMLKVPNLSASSDLQAGADLTVGVNASVGGTLGVTGITTLTGDVTASSGLHIDGGAVANSMIVEDLTNNRVVFAGTGGELEDSAGLTFDGTSLAVSASGGIDVNQGDLEVTAGAISGSGNLQAGGALTVGGNADLNGTLDVADVARFATHISASGDISVVDGQAIAGAGALDITAAGLMSITASAGKIALSGSGGIELGVASVALSESVDSLLFVDDDDGLVKKGSLSTLIGTVGGDGIQVASGVMSIVTVVDYFSSGSSAGGTLSTDLATASLSQIALSSSIQVFLNGMLQVVSGAVNVATGSGGVANIGAFDYKYSGSSGITGFGTSEDGVSAIIFEDGLDYDDVVQIRYIKK